MSTSAATVLNWNHAVANHVMSAPACVGQASRLSPVKISLHLLVGNRKLFETPPQGDPAKSETGATPVLRHGSGRNWLRLFRLFDHEHFNRFTAGHQFKAELVE